MALAVCFCCRVSSYVLYLFHIKCLQKRLLAIRCRGFHLSFAVFPTYSRRLGFGCRGLRKFLRGRAILYFSRTERLSYIWHGRSHCLRGLGYYLVSDWTHRRLRIYIGVGCLSLSKGSVTCNITRRSSGTPQKRGAP